MSATGGEERTSRDSQDKDHDFDPTSYVDTELSDGESQNDNDVSYGPSATASGLWNYFEVDKKPVDKGQVAPAICKINVGTAENVKKCGHSCKRTGGNTSSMKSHLKTKHNAIFLKYMMKSTDSSCTTSTSQEPEDTAATSSTSSKTIAQRNEALTRSDSSKVTTARRQATLSFTKLDKKTIDDCAMGGAYLLAAECLPYSLVDSDGFRKFVEVLRPGLGRAFPGRRAMTDNYIPRMYIETVETIKSLLKEADYISLTMDGWTSVAKEAFIGATAHFINLAWELVSVTLGCMPTDESHTAANLAEFTESMLQQWNIKKDSVSSVTVDNGANFVAAVRELGIPIIKCFAHSLQLGIASVYDHGSVKPVIKKVTQILNTVNASSSLRLDMFQTAKAMGRECVQIPLSCKTRWWTLLRTAVAVNRNLPQLRIVLAKERRTADRRRPVTYSHLLFTAEEEDVLRLLLSILEPLEAVTEDLSSETYVTGSAILPLVNAIDQILQRAVVEVETDSLEFENMEKDDLTKDLAALIKVSLLDRYINFQGTGLLATDGRKSYRHLTITSFVDPRFKDTFLESEPEKNEVKKYVEEECVALSPREPSETAASGNSNDSISISPPKKSKVVGLAAIFQRLPSTETVLERTPTEKARLEIAAYTRLPVLDMTQNPLQWWKVHAHSMPLLAKVARKHLCGQGSSVPSERVFSKGGNVVDDYRTCLTGEHVNQLVFLSMNKRFISVPKSKPGLK
ncbi:E3 SUMO-protein ligase ZBED1 [Frankliniella fusca]|uniref:E3 SUMO-protein ligase ZBED1 n=1 Tax=Frankliniella fusca TaxID=407009 RepID=A0AAE1LAT3_9NEOP|nr:E3 SUMO-protein ligase ZBED1 [Frankliniella fusca]